MCNGRDRLVYLGVFVMRGVWGLWLLAIFATAVPGHAEVEFFKSAQDISSGLAKSPGDTSFEFESAIATGYVYGIYDSLTEDRVLCSPEELTRDALGRMVLNHLQQSIAPPRINAAEAVSAALFARFACDRTARGPDSSYFQSVSQIKQGLSDWFASDSSGEAQTIAFGYIIAVHDLLAHYRLVCTPNGVTQGELAREVLNALPADNALAPRNAVGPATVALHDRWGCSGILTPDDRPSEFTFSNGTGFALHYIYIRQTGTTEWGNDVLGDMTLDPEEEGALTFDSAVFTPGLRMDIRAIDIDGDSYTIYDVPLAAREFELLPRHLDSN